MFITVKGNRNDKIIVNAQQIKFIVPNRHKGEELGSTIIMGNECYIETNSTVDEIEYLLKESEDAE